MTVWADPATSPYFEGWYADLGAYIGPWPVMAPAVLPDDTRAGVQFVVTDPNPDTPDDPATTLDGSYPTNVFTAERDWAFDGVDTVEQYTQTAEPSGDPLGPGAAPTVGMRIYVVALTSAEPADPPEFYVPPSYAGGGFAAFETMSGGWSDWQDGTVTTHAALTGDLAGSVINQPNRAQQNDREVDKVVQTNSGAIYPVGLPRETICEPRTLSPYGGPGFIAGGEVDILAQYAAGVYTETRTVRPNLAQYSMAFIASPIPDPQGADVTPGVLPMPVAASLGQGDGIQLEPRTDGQPVEPVITWPLVPQFLQPGDPQDAYNQSGDAGTTVGVDAIFAITVGAAGDLPWWFDTNGHFTQDTGPSTEIPAPFPVQMVYASEAFGTALNPGPGGGSAVLHGTFDPAPLDLSGLTADPERVGSNRTVVAYWSTVQVKITGPAAVDDPPTPDGITASTIGAGVYITCEVNPYAMITDADNAFRLPDPVTGVPYVARNPRWRYWRPNTIAPAAVLRTVGDHFDTPPGTTVRMLQPSGRWLPIRKHA